ncbi:MAG: hydrogen peroxide-inducible genes activator, partial [Rhodospirillaceae bacterium]
MKNIPTLRQLRYLVAVEETRHFGRAAEACLVTQSTLSAGIQELESLLGVRLIERRSRRQVVFTPLGEDIVERARGLLADAESLVDTAKAGAEPLAGELRLGVIPTIGPYLVPGLLQRLAQDYPNLKLFLREDQSSELLSRLNGGRLDVALMALPYALGDLPHMEVGREDLVVALPNGHDLAALDRVPVTALEEASLLMLEDGHCLRDHSIEACGLANRGGQRNEAYQATSLSTLVQMVAGGIGITLLPRISTRVEGRAGAPIVLKNLQDVGPARTLVLVWRAANPRARDFRLLGEVVKAEVAEALKNAAKQGGDTGSPAPISVE